MKEDRADSLAHPESIALTKCECPALPFSEIVAKRQSTRSWAAQTLTFDQLSSVLHYTLGVNPSPPARRFVPSSGGLNTVLAHIVALDVINFRSGLYTYAPNDDCLILVKHGDFRVWSERKLLFQRSFAKAGALLVLESNVGVTCSKYGPKGYRLSAIDTGIVCQQIYLVAASLGLNVCATGGFFEHELRQAFKMRSSSIPALILAIG